MPQGYKKDGTPCGFKKGHIPKTKGKIGVVSEETRKKISESHKGMKGTPWSEERKKRHGNIIKINSNARKTMFKKGDMPPKFRGKSIDKFGYIYIYSPKHPYHNARNNVFEHRLVIEKHIGRYLLRHEVGHHINEIKDDNRPENLMAFTSNFSHMRFHKNPNNVKPEEIIFDGRRLPLVADTRES